MQKYLGSTSTPQIADMDNALSMVFNDDYYKVVKTNEEYMQTPIPKVNGGVTFMSNGGNLRDTYRVLSPIQGASTVTKEVYFQTQDDISVLLEKGKHLNGADPTEKERREAFQREYQRTMAAAAEMTQFYEEHRDVLGADDVDHVRMMENLSWIQITFKKAQQLEKITAGYYKLSLRKDQTLITDEERAGLEKAYEVLGGMWRLTHYMVKAINAHDTPGYLNYEATLANSRESMQGWRDEAAGISKYSKQRK
jgi:hypothetical protein